MYTPTDILVRKTADGDTLWVSQRLIVECCDITNNHSRKIRTIYKQSLPPSWAKLVDQPEFFLGDSGKSWRWGRKGGQFYYDYDRVPDRSPSNYRSKLPTKDELLTCIEDQNLRGSRERETQARNMLLEAIASIENNDDVFWLQTQSGYMIDIATARDYGRALAWCRLIKQVVAMRQFEQFGAATIADFYQLCVDLLSKQQIKNLRTHTVKSLRNKIASMPSELNDQRAWIISGKYGNNNRQIVGKVSLVNYDTGEIYPFDVHQAVMYAAYMNLNGPEKETLIALYNDTYAPLIAEFGMTPVEYRTFCNHLSRFSSRIKNDRARHGNDYYKKHLLTYIPTERLTYSHSLFCGDGSGLFAYRYSKKGELNYMNLYAMLITDVATGYIAGWSVAPEGWHYESPDMVRSAVKMAVAAGGNQTMFEFISDNHGAFTKAESKEWLRDVFRCVRTIEPHNSQANPAETYFRLFKNSTLRSQKNFVRTSHNASISNRANLDSVGVWQYPTYSEAIEQLKERIEKWNNTVRPNQDRTPAELFAQTKNPNCLPIDPIQLRKIFGTRTKSELTRCRGFVMVGPKGRETQYEIPDYETNGAELISKATGNAYYDNVNVIYDDQCADIYSADGKYIASCPRAGKASQSFAEKTDDQRTNQLRHKYRKVRQMEVVKAHEEAIYDAMDYLNSTWGAYGENVAFGGDKESINGQYEGLVSVEISTALKAKAEKTRRKLDRVEALTKASIENKANKELNNRRRALRDKRLSEIYK